MPNWCHTTLNVNGSKEQIKEFSSLVSDAIENDNGLCNAIIPKPEAEAENWYNWNCKNWGSKWDVTDISVEFEDDTQINLSFDTAWNPITPIFDELVKRGLNVLAEYQDEGYMFAGGYENGKVTNFGILVCEDCQELDEPNDECTCEGAGVIIIR
tara:strand:+ start:2699 stop:3163 length:465 start_codon:yes stop_codon:yes gene_type:complete